MCARGARESSAPLGSFRGIFWDRSNACRSNPSRSTSGPAREQGAPDVKRVASWIICNGREQPLDEGEHLLGRDAESAVPLSSSTVSRHHARITVNGQIAILEDLGSKNGTYLRGQVVTAPMRLTDGDQIRIGAFELTFRSLAAPGSTETAG